QQIMRLEATLGRPLLTRNSRRVIPTAEGERLLSYARRLLALAQEARDVVAQPSADGVVRLGIPEDFGAYRLTRMLSQFARARACLFHSRVSCVCEVLGRAWHIAYTSPNFVSIQASVSAGLGVSILPDVGILADHRVLKAKDGFGPVVNTELALIAAPDASPA